MAEAESFYATAERRVERLTAIIGVAGAVLALGAGLTWLNFRWLKAGVSALVQASVAQAGAEHARIPRSVYVKFFARYALLLAVVYVILSRSVLPLAALIGGLFAAVAAVVAEVVWELVTGKLGAESRT
jgi:hypothetical protein